MSNNKLSILVVKAHPHDFTHCAGTLGIHSNKGDLITLVVVTGGKKAHNEKLATELLKPKSEQDQNVINESPEKYADQKAQELRQAAALFGISDVRILDGDEPFRVDQNPKIINEIAEIISEVRPQVLITQSPYINDSGPHGLIQPYVNNSHSETAYAVERAQSLALNPEHGSQIRPHKIAATFYPGVYFDRGDWDIMVDISGWYEQRVEAEILFKSQGHNEAFARKRIEISCGAAGWTAGTAYAEGFVRSKPELFDSITLSPRTLQKAEESPQEHMDRITGAKK